MRAVFLTAGAAGMYCGSCMHDNALARALRADGADCVLQPVYTPIRTDSPSVADEHVFFGGIHIYLLQRIPWLRHVPAPIRRALDWSPLIRLATRRTHTTSATSLGQLTVSMLQGIEGRQADEVNRLVDWLEKDMHADAVLLSNLLIGGALPTIRSRLPQTRLIVLLQGDDIFIDYLPPDLQQQALKILRGLVDHVDRFVVHSQFYRDKMGALLEIPMEKMVVTPLSIDAAPFANADNVQQPHNEFRLGYLARIAPEKGLHRMVDAFIQLAGDPEHADLTLQVAGWLGESNHAYLQQQRDKIEQAGLKSRFHYHGSPDLDQKIAFLRSLDLLSVPTDYEEPKGLFVLESLAAGVPVVQPDHGAFPELIAATGGGLVVEPNSVDALCEGIAKLKSQPQLRTQLGEQGRRSVTSNHTIEKAAHEMKKILFEV